MPATTTGAAPSLRESLRAGLAADHARLDAQVSAFDLGTPGGVAAFLSLNASGLDWIRQGGEGTFVTGADLEELAARCRADMARLRIPVPPPARRPAPLAAIAIDYVVLGSRLGTEVLRRRWAAANPGATPLAWFEARDRGADWRAFCAAAGQAAPDGRALADGRRIFRRYEALARGLGRGMQP